MDRDERKERAKRAMQQIRDGKKNPDEIAQQLDGRVSARTLYRWLHGTATPQRERDVVELEKLINGT